MQTNDRSLGGFYLYNGKQDSPQPQEDSGKGKIANALSKAISYERTPELFDTKEIQDRDEEITALEKLRESDIKLCIDRRDKPVVLTSYQARIVHALSYAISQEAETSEDVKKKIQNATRSGQTINRNLNVTAITSLIFGSTRKRYKEIVIRELYNLSRMRQVQILGSGDNKVKITAPLILIGRTMEDLSPEKRNNLDFVEIIFGSAFFYGLNNRFAVITPKLFEVWGKNGRGTELFNVLLSSIFSVYWSYRQAANKTEERIRTDKANKSLSRSEIEAAVRAARKNAMCYELNVAKIKKRVTTDYESNSANKARFWKDLNNAIEGFKELNLIIEANVKKGVKGQEKVSFILSDSYNMTINEEEPKLLGDDPSENSDQPSAF